MARATPAARPVRNCDLRRIEVCSWRCHVVYRCALPYCRWPAPDTSFDARCALDRRRDGQRCDLGSLMRSVKCDALDGHASRHPTLIHQSRHWGGSGRRTFVLEPAFPPRSALATSATREPGRLVLRRIPSCRKHLHMAARHLPNPADAVRGDHPDGQQVSKRHPRNF